MADNDSKHDGVNSADAYLNGIAEYIQVLQDMKKLSPQIAIGAEDLIRLLKQFQKDFMFVDVVKKELGIAGEADEGKAPLDDGNEEG